MKNTRSKVASLGHFDNFTCWQLGEESNAHTEGLKVMVDEIAFLSKEEEGEIQVSVFGGYTDERGDATRNSMSLLSALHNSATEFEVRCSKISINSVDS